MQNIKEWQAAFTVIEQLEEAGFEAVVVGGAVRDAILNRPAHDVDVATNALPQEVKTVFNRTVDIGIQHGTILVIVPEGPVEVTTYRTDGEYTDHRRPEEVHFVRSLKEDLQRRDFTMNAIAMRRDGSFVDFYGGQRDIEASVIRAVGEAKVRFAEDALRMLRAVRFSAQLGFSIEASSFTLVVAVAVTMAIKTLYKHVEPAIKWPNDLLINGKKCTGILTEMQAEADLVQALLVGIGINANQLENDFSPDIADIATSLRIAAGEEINRAALVATILQYLEQFTALYVKEGFSSIKALWEQMSCTIGQRIEVTTLRERFEGIASGITDDGVLQLTQNDGTIRTIYSGDIKIL
ncbi:CCA-adding enzyme [Lysinibacillus sphaericus]